jgi:glutamine synthetase
LLAYAPDFMLLSAPYANSYRRFRPGSFTPMNSSWAWENRSCLVRLTGSGQSARLEFRLPGADANPYFVYAGMIAAGLAGVEAGLTLPPPVSGDASVAALPLLPRDLTEAFWAFARSEIAKSALGDRVHGHLAALTREELEIERGHVTDRDLRRCFEAA